MSEYLVPINRYQFTQFYRYGYTFIPKSILLQFDGQISDGTKQELAKHFSVISPFEYDEEFLILHLSKDEEPSAENVLFDVEEIVAVYPLSKQAKLSIQEKIDQRIKLEEPFFESVLQTIEDNIRKREIERAIKALWKICNIEENIDSLLTAIGMDNILIGLSYRRQGIKASNIENGNYWSVLIAYDRFSYFSNEVIGYFYDAGEVFAYSKNMPTFEGSSLHGFLNDLSENLKTKQIISAIDYSELAKNYRTQTTSDGLKSYVIAPLFLMLKDELRKVDDLNTTKLIKHTIELKKFGAQFNAALILLGSFFGYKKFYDLYYDKLNLRFFKSYKSSLDGITEQEKLPIVGLSENLEIEVQSDELVQVESDPNNHTSVDGVSTKKTDVVVMPSPIPEKEVDLGNVALEIVQIKGEMTVANLGKEIYNQTRQRLKSAIIENVIKNIAEIETFKDKKVKKVRLKTK